MLQLRVDKVLSVLDVSEVSEFYIPLQQLLRPKTVKIVTLDGRSSAETVN
jgi:hypothetical protein